MHSEFLMPHEYPNEPRLRDLPRTLFYWPRIGLLALIRLYQMTLSRTLASGTCRFYPSCSDYARLAIMKYGILKGGMMSLIRIFKCHPFHPGGYNPP